LQVQVVLPDFDLKTFLGSMYWMRYGLSNVLLTIRCWCGAFSCGPVLMRALGYNYDFSFIDKKKY
jgi:hypothetical protein